METSQHVEVKGGQLNLCVSCEQMMQHLQQQCLALVGIQQQWLLPVLILGSLDPH